MEHLSHLTLERADLHHIDGAERYSQSNSMLLEEPSFTYDPNIARDSFENHDERVLRERRKQVLSVFSVFSSIRTCR